MIERMSPRNSGDSFRNSGGQEIGRRMTGLLYGRDHGYSVILDAGASTSPVVVALDDVTKEIVGLYDRTYPVLP